MTLLAPEPVAANSLQLDLLFLGAVLVGRRWRVGLREWKKVEEIKEELRD